MTGQYTASRFGQDLPTRIAASTVMLTEATDIVPGGTMVQPLIPFYPGGVVSGDGSSTSGVVSGSWEKTPSECDLTFYQGDDVLIPLYIQDPNNPTSDMSDQNAWEWHAQVRVYPYWRTLLVVEFNIDSQYFPPQPPDAPVGRTLVQLFLPREQNKYCGDFEWELYSISPQTYSDEFPPPDDWPDDEPWPPETALRTWLKGNCKILPRTTTTDVLPTPVIPPSDTGVVVTQSIFVGPNGRVP